MTQRHQDIQLAAYEAMQLQTAQSAHAQYQNKKTLQIPKEIAYIMTATTHRDKETKKIKSKKYVERKQVQYVLHTKTLRINTVNTIYK